MEQVRLLLTINMKVKRIVLVYALIIPVAVLVWAQPDTPTLDIAVVVYALASPFLASVVVRRTSKLTPELEKALNDSKALALRNKKSAKILRAISNESKRLEDGTLTDEERENLVESIGDWAFDLLENIIDELGIIDPAHSLSDQGALKSELASLETEFKELAPGDIRYWLHGKLKAFAEKVDSSTASVLANKLNTPVTGTTVRLLVDAIDHMQFYA